MIKPSIGRVVWYQPNDADAEALGAIAFGARSEPLAADIAHVHSDIMVNLMVIDPNGNPHSRTSVRLVQTDEMPLVGESFCEWMPYQVGQAKKHEAAPAA